jgi:hypothetical protein
MKSYWITVFTMQLFTLMGFGCGVLFGYGMWGGA